MAFDTRTPTHLLADMNLVPMIDVLLVLLIVFMLAQQARRVLSVTVPPPVETTRSGTSHSIVLELRTDGRYAVNKTIVAFDELGDYLATLYATRPDKALFIQTAPTRRYQEFIDAADIARSAGVQVVGFMPY